MSNPDPETIVTVLNYNVDNGKRQAFSRCPQVKISDDFLAETAAPFVATVRNARCLPMTSPAPSLDTFGFTLARQKTSLSRDDFFNGSGTPAGDKKIKEVYYSEISALICGITGCVECRPFHHQVRSGDATKTHVDDGRVEKPAGAVHCDYSCRNALNLFESMCPKEFLKRGGGGGGKFAVINAWRNINEHFPIANDHLAMCDASSIVAPDDFIPLDLYLRNGQVSESYRLDVGRAHSHRWYYYPKMVKDEVLLFTQYSSDPNSRARFTFHTSIKDPTAAATMTSPTSPTSTTSSSPIFRESIELRCICFFPDFSVNTIPRFLANGKSVVDSGVKKLVSLVSYLPDWDEVGRRYVRSVYYSSAPGSASVSSSSSSSPSNGLDKLVRALANDHIRNKMRVADGQEEMTEETFEAIVRKVIDDGEFKRIVELHLRPFTDEERIPEAVRSLTTGVRPDLVSAHWKDKIWAVNFLRQLGIDKGSRQIASALVKYSCDMSENGLNPASSEATRHQVVEKLVACEEFKNNCRVSFS